MTGYALRRIAAVVPLLIGLSVALFLYLQLIPGDPIAGMLGPNADPDLVARLRTEFGLDRPILVQYADWVAGLSQGDLGVSFASRKPIAPILLERIPATLHLTLAGMFCAVVIGFPLGFVAAMKQNSWVDRLLSFLVILGLSSPAFWIATLLILLLSIQLGWLPSQGYVPLAEDPFRSLVHTVMPALTLGLGFAPYLARITRSSTVQVLREPFYVYSVAKGLRSRTRLFRYALRNAVGPVVIVVGLQLGSLVGGQVVVESIFAWPGLGRLLVDGVVQRDYFVVQAVILSTAMVVIFLNLAAELLQGLLDPRIRRNQALR